MRALESPRLHILSLMLCMSHLEIKKKTRLGPISLKRDMLTLIRCMHQPLCVFMHVCAWVCVPSCVDGCEHVFVCLIDMLLICWGLAFPQYHVCLQLKTDS